MGYAGSMLAFFPVSLYSRILEGERWGRTSLGELVPSYLVTHV